MGIKVSGLSKSINQQLIIENVTFDWQPGRIIGLVGRNGAGKTTLFRTMAAHYLADHGTLVIDGEDVAQKPAVRRRLFYIDTQNNFFNHQPLSQLIKTYALSYDHFDSQRMLRLLAEEQLTATSHYQQLSKGQRMLFQILLALASQTPYIILDEPFDGLDVLVRERIVARIVDEMTSRQASFLISSHNLDELDGLCDQILFLKKHQLIANYNLEQLRATARKFQLVFPQKEVPAIVKETGQLIKVYGRVLEVYFADYTPTIEAALQAADPVMMADQPITVTDVFRVKLGDHQAVMVGE